MKEKVVVRNGLKVVFLDNNPFADYPMSRLIPLLTEEQIAFIDSRNWNYTQKLRRMREFAEENQCSVKEEE